MTDWRCSGGASVASVAATSALNRSSCSFSSASARSAGSSIARARVSHRLSCLQHSGRRRARSGRLRAPGLRRLASGVDDHRMQTLARIKRPLVLVFSRRPAEKVAVRSTH